MTKTTEETTPLSPEILDRFLAALRFAGAPLGNLIEPGLTDAEVDGVAKDLGLPVPPELRTLWKWGIPSKAAASVEAGWDINPRFELWPPDDAVKSKRFYEEFIPELGPCIAFAGPPQTSCLLVHADAAAPTSPVTYARVDDPDLVQVAPSLGAIFETWTNQLLSGTFRFVGEEWHWNEDDGLPFP